MLTLCCVLTEIICPVSPQLVIAADKKCAAKEIADLPYAGSGYDYALEDTYGLVPNEDLEPFGMDMSCVGSDCTATLTATGAGYMALPVSR